MPNRAIVELPIEVWVGYKEIEGNRLSSRMMLHRRKEDCKHDMEMTHNLNGEWMDVVGGGLRLNDEGNFYYVVKEEVHTGSGPDFGD